MIYFSFKYSNSPKSYNSNIISRILKKIIPQANPNFDDKYQFVDNWYIEYDEVEEITEREVGTDTKGVVIVKAPFKDNFGFWVDNNLKMEDYSKFSIKHIYSEDFNQLWNTEIITDNRK